MRVIDNQDEYLADLAQQIPKRKRHSLEFLNAMDYAQILHDKEGYSVFSDGLLIKTTGQWLKELVESDQPLNVRTVGMALDGAGFEAINWHRSYSSKMRPPVRQKQGPRKAHPAPLNWADITGNLKAAYTHIVNDGRPTAPSEYR